MDYIYLQLDFHSFLVHLKTAVTSQVERMHFFNKNDKKATLLKMVGNACMISF